MRLKVEFDSTLVAEGVNKRVWLFVADGTVANIKQLARVILREFGLKHVRSQDVALYKDGFLLPPLQPLSLISDSDAVWFVW